MKKKIIFALLAAVVAGGTAAAALRLSIHVEPDFLHSSDAYSDPAMPDEVYITRKYIHFSEDYHADKSVRSFSDRCSFSLFTIRKGKLSRDLFYIINPEGVDDDGFYRIQCDIVKKEVRKTIRIYDVRMTRISKLPTRLSEIRSEFGKKIAAVADELGTADLSPLYLSEPRPVKAASLPQAVAAAVFGKGDALEYICGGGGRHLFRFRIANADTEAQKRERSAARGYYCYLDYNVTKNRVDAYYAIVDYSVYIK